MTIRPATLDDIPWASALMKEFASSLELPPFDPEPILIHLLGHVFFVAERDGELLGCIGGELAHHPFGGQLILNEYFWYVDKRYRSLNVGKDLLDAYTESARMYSAIPKLSTMHNSPDLDNLLASRGYKLIERIYTKMD